MTFVSPAMRNRGSVFAWAVFLGGVIISLSGCISQSINPADEAKARQNVHRLQMEANRKKEEMRKRDKVFRDARRRQRRASIDYINATTSCLIASPHALAVAADALEDRKSIKRFLPKDGSSSQKDQKKLFETMGIENIYGSGGSGGGC